MKWQRKYKLVIQAASGEEIIIQPPFTLRFTIQRHLLSSLNTATFQIYNLNKTTRALLFKDFYNQTEYRKITLYAGYDTLSKVFEGYLFSGSSFRERADIITVLTSKDGGFDVANTQMQQTYVEGTKYTDLFKDCIGLMPNVQLGTIGNFEGEFKRPVTIDDTAWNTATTYSSGQCFMDLQKAHFLKDNEVITGELTEIDAATGLLSTPVRQEGWFSFKMLFEPRLKIGQYAIIKSSVMKEYNGEYKVVGIQHQGIISEAENGACDSNIQMLVGDSVFGGAFINV